MPSLFRLSPETQRPTWLFEGPQGGAARGPFNDIGDPPLDSTLITDPGKYQGIWSHPAFFCAPSRCLLFLKFRGRPFLFHTPAIEYKRSRIIVGGSHPSLFSPSGGFTRTLRRGLWLRCGRPLKDVTAAVSMKSMVRDLLGQVQGTAGGLSKDPHNDEVLTSIFEIFHSTSRG